jgi:hypothetical protein
MVLCFLLSFAGAAGALSQLAKRDLNLIPWYEWYFVVSLIFCGFIFGCQSWKNRTFRKEYLGFGISFLLIVLFQYLDLHSVSLWLDEDYQIWSSIFQLPIEAGIGQHQPPLHFAIMGGWLNLVYPTELSTRGWSLLFSGLGGGLLFYYVKIFSGSWWPTIFLLPMFFIHPFIARYSFEVRPISLGILTMILWVGILFEMLRTRDTFSWYVVLPVTFLSLVSLGFQPLALGLGLGIAVMLFPDLNINSKIRYLSALIGGVILFLPIQWQIILKSPPRLDRVSSFSFEHFFSAFRVEKFMDFFLFYLWPLAPVFIFGLLFFFLLKKNKKDIQNIFEISVLVISIVLSVMLITIPFFASYVDWNLNTYYFLFIWPILLLGFGVIFGRIFSGEQLAVISLVAFFVISSLILTKSVFFRSILSFQEPRSDIRSAIAYSVEVARGEGETLILPVCGGGAADWCPNWIVGKDVYLNTDVISDVKVIFPPLDLPNFFTKFFTEKQKVKKIVWIYQTEWSRLDLRDEFMQKHKQFSHRDFYKVRVLVQDSESGDSRLDILKTLEGFEEYSVSKGRDAFWLRSLLAIASLQMGKKEKANEWYLKVKHLKNAGDVNYFLQTFEKLQGNH